MIEPIATFSCRRTKGEIYSEGLATGSKARRTKRYRVGGSRLLSSGVGEWIVATTPRPALFLCFSAGWMSMRLTPDDRNSSAPRRQGTRLALCPLKSELHAVFL